jgi:hypothetical protein
LTSHVHDDGFREIQLNGKQLFFLFMATTVVSVVIFLCGVLVGRGVRIERNLIASTGLGESSTTEATPVATAVPAAIEPAPASAPPTTAPPSSPGGDDELRQMIRAATSKSHRLLSRRSTSGLLWKRKALRLPVPRRRNRSRNRRYRARELTPRLRRPRHRVPRAVPRRAGRCREYTI